jgi:poly(3-hydroxyalkanoate) synthetase
VASDLGKIKTPAFILSTREDHIAGVINPPQAGKYCYWTHSRNAWDLEKMA